MKTQYFVLSFFFLFTTLFTGHAQKGNISSLKTENIKVWGECGMCKKKIENASRNAGAETASWNEENKMLAVSYNPFKTNTIKIQQSIAAAGYDTKDMVSTSEAYNKLPECCHYQRKVVAGQVAINCCTDKMNCASSATCCTDAKCDKDNSACPDMGICKEKGCCKS